MWAKLRKPGERVPVTGIYRVEHGTHRLMHHAILPQGIRFPMCRKCGERVCFSLVRSVKKEQIPFRSSEILLEFQTGARRSRA
jgi:hypothetical protein